MISYILSGLSILLVIIIIKLLYNNKKNLEQEKQKYIQKKKKEIDSEIQKEQKLLQTVYNQRKENEQKLRQEKETAKQLIDSEKEKVDLVVKQLEEKKKTAEDAQKEILEQKTTNLDLIIQSYYEKEKEDYERTLRAVQTTLQEDAEAELSQIMGKYYEEIFQLRHELDEYKAKRDAINEQILRQRAIEEKQDFYRVCLSQNDIDDIHILNSIRANLHKHDGLDKLIYDFYISKPVQEMVKRVLGGSAPSGIYKITRLKTGEIYIGKSTDIKSRWQQHAKTVFGCGTIAHSILHTTMEKDGIENFTFELLEEVPKDKLTEREKYWIGFYDTKKYGLNEREG